MAIVAKFKAIKPKKLNEKAIRQAIRAALEQTAKDVASDFQKTTSTWKNKPKFVGTISTRSGGAEFLVGTDDEIYRYVNEGTKPHVIRPVRAKVLAFAGTYQAKTTPRVIGSGGGGPSGDIMFRRVVNHPGTKAREFDKVIAEKWEKAFKARMVKAMKEAAKASGHGM